MGRCLKCGNQMPWEVGICLNCQAGLRAQKANEEDYFTRLRKQQQQSAVSCGVSETIKAKPLNGYIKKRWYRNGDFYSGYMQDSYRHGRGKFTRKEDKYTYDGDWYMNKRQGCGEEEMPGKWRFSGEFYDNKRNGFGKLVCNNGEVCEGEWKDNKMHGFGERIYPNGNRYEGEFFEGHFNGNGVYFDAVGNVTYEGEFKDGKMNGHAVAHYADGSIYEGCCVDNVKVGNGKKIAPDGTVTLGHWEGDSFIADSVSHGKNAESSVKYPSVSDTYPLEPDEKEFDASPEILVDFMESGAVSDNSSESKPSEESMSAVELMPDFQKRFIYFDQALYGIDRYGVLHISSRMKKNRGIIEAYDGMSNVESISCYGVENIIILGSDKKVIFADSMWKKGLLSDKAIKAALPEILNWSELSAVACGSKQFVGLHTDGTVIGTGNKICHLEELAEWTDIKDIACGIFGTVGLRNDGTVISCGFPKDVANELSAWTDISAIACGENHIVGLRKNGTVVACGKNSNGQCDVGGFCNVGMISASVQCTALIMNDGTVKALGKYNNAGIPDRDTVAAMCFSLDRIISLDGKGCLHGDTSGVDMAEFIKDFEW